MASQDPQPTPSPRQKSRVTLRQERLQRKQQRESQKLSVRRQEQKLARKQKGLVVTQDGSRSTLVSNVGSAVGLLSRQKCVLVMGDGSDEAFNTVMSLCKKSMTEVGLDNADQVVVQCKMSSMFDDISTLQMPPQRNIQHAILLLDAAEFIGAGTHEETVAAIAALDKLKANLPTNKRKITIVFSDVRGLIKEEKIDSEMETESKNEESVEEGEPLLVPSGVDSHNADNSSVGGDNASEISIVTGLYETDDDMLLNDRLWQRLRFADGDNALYQFKRIDALWSMHTTLNQKQEFELDRRMRQVAQDIDPEAVQRAQSFDIFKYFCCCCRKGSTEYKRIG